MEKIKPYLYIHFFRNPFANKAIIRLTLAGAYQQDPEECPSAIVYDMECDWDISKEEIRYMVEQTIRVFRDDEIHCDLEADFKEWY